MITFVFTLICCIGLFGMMLLMCGPEGTRRVLWNLRDRGLYYYGIMILLVMIYEHFFRSVLLPLLLLYVFLICFGKDYLKHFYSSAIRGLLCIIAMILSEIFLTVKIFGEYVNLIYAADAPGDKVVLLCALQMIIVQYLVIVTFEIYKSEKNYRRILLELIGIKNIEELCLMYFSLGKLMGGGINPGTGLIVAAALLIDYAIYVIVIVQLKPVKSHSAEKVFHTNAYEYYVHMEEEHIRIRRLYHDMKNQIMIMQRDENYSSEPIQNYLQNVEAQMDEIPKFYHTGKVALDMLLFEARKKAKVAQIEFDAVISEGCLSFMEDEDLNVLFTNAIVNAWEACEKITEGERKIIIRAGRNVNDVLLCFKNTVGEKRKSESLFTSKKDKKMHGIGLTTIQKTAEKYQGYVSVLEEETTFQLAILFVREKENEKDQN